METGHDHHHSYGQLPDLRRLLRGNPIFPPTPQQLPYHFPDPNLHHETTTSPFNSLVLPRFQYPPPPPPPHEMYGNNGVEMERDIARWGLGINDGGNSRWPRQETLTLLEIRSRLDCKFKEANQKGPLWDQVSRIMEEEHGYHRSGKKCREKFENLYKYYKKTKEGKAGRQDGKNYRFFLQLEALYGDQTKPNSSIQQTILDLQEIQNQHHLKLSSDQSLSFSNVSEFDALSSDNELHSMENPKKKGWKAKVKRYVESKMKKMMETQEEWMERMLKTIEEREQERVLREEEWRREEKEKMEKEHEFWAKKRAWFEARDVELMNVLNKISGKGVKEEIEEEMVNLGYEGNYGVECREKWENVLLMRRSNVGFLQDVQENFHVGVETIDEGESNWERYYGLKMMSKGKSHM